MVFVRDSIVRKTGRALSNEDEMVVCFQRRWKKEDLF